jgi:Zn-dependent peptidase ImmA (M78 family)
MTLTYSNLAVSAHTNASKALKNTRKGVTTMGFSFELQLNPIVCTFEIEQLISLANQKPEPNFRFLVLHYFSGFGFWRADGLQSA